jgi:hypothetical protein
MMKRLSADEGYRKLLEEVREQNLLIKSQIVDRLL